MTARLTLSIADLRAAGACGLDRRVADLRAVLPDVADNDEVDVRVWWSLPSTTPADAIWSLRAARPQKRAVVMAVLVARCAAVRAQGYAAAAAYWQAAIYAADAAARAARAARALPAVRAAAADAADAASTAAAGAAAYAASTAAAAAAAAAAERAAQMADLLAALEVAP